MSFYFSIFIFLLLDSGSSGSRAFFLLFCDRARKLWNDFIQKYKQYILSNTDVWLNNLKLVEDYITTNKKLPSLNDKNKQIKALSKWVSTQQSNYKNNKLIMKDENIRKLWKDFINNKLSKE